MIALFLENQAGSSMYEEPLVNCSLCKSTSMYRIQSIVNPPYGRAGFSTCFLICANMVSSTSSTLLPWQAEVRLLLKTFSILMYESLEPRTCSAPSRSSASGPTLSHNPHRQLYLGRPHVLHLFFDQCLDVGSHHRNIPINSRFFDAWDAKASECLMQRVLMFVRCEVNVFNF